MLIIIELIEIVFMLTNLSLYYCIGKDFCCVHITIIIALQGTSSLLPLAAFFCSICCEFTKDKTHAELHVKSVEHNSKFKVIITSFLQSFLKLQFNCKYQFVCVR